MLREKEHKALLTYLIVLIIFGSFYLLYEIAADHLNIAYKNWGAAIIALNLVPILLYLKKTKKNIPFLPLIGLHYIISFGLPVFFMELEDFYLGKLELNALVIGFFSLLSFYFFFYFSNYFINIKSTFSPFKIEDSHNTKLLKTTMYFFVAITIMARIFSLSLLYHFTEPSLYVFTGLFFYLKFKKSISAGENILIIGFIAVEIFLRILSGMLAGVAVFLLYMVLSNYVINEKFNVVPVIFFIVVYALIYPVKHDFRKLVWFGDKEYSTLEKVVVLQELVLKNFNNDQELLKDDHDEKEDPFLGRFSYPASALSLVQSMTPSVIPYWEGYTFLPLFSKFVPRVIWPDKPTEEIGQEFGHRYRLLASNNSSTSMNLPWMAELYANWGKSGAYIGYALLGILFAFLDKYFNNKNSSVLNQLVSAAIIFQLVTHESNFSLQTGNIPLLALALFIFISSVRKYVVN